MKLIAKDDIEDDLNTCELIGNGPISIENVEL